MTPRDQGSAVDATSQYVSSWTLKNGTTVTIRPIRPDDEPAMVKFHATLSDRTVYFRYFTSVSYPRRTAHERLVRVCTIDYRQEMVLVAEHNDLQRGKRSILGVGRLNKLDSKSEGEIAVLVSDDWQRQGLGRELLCRLIQVGRDEKLNQVVAEILRDNLAMHGLLKKLGFRFQLLNSPGSIRAILSFR